MIIITCNFSVAQVQEEIITKDTTSVSSGSSFTPFNETKSYYLYKYSTKQFTEFNSLALQPDLNFSTNPYLYILSLETSEDFLQSKRDLQRVLDNQYSIIKSQSLGTFGEVLSVAAASAAAGLAVYHVIKYKEAYGLK